MDLKDGVFVTSVLCKYTGLYEVGVRMYGRMEYHHVELDIVNSRCFMDGLYKRFNVVFVDNYDDAVRMFTEANYTCGVTIDMEYLSN
jgi:hypothetical protein